VLAAAAGVHHLEVRLLQTRIERLSAIVREHGLSLPAGDSLLGVSDGEHLAACRRVVVAAYDLLGACGELEAALADLRQLVGSGMELLEDRSWRA